MVVRESSTWTEAVGALPASLAGVSASKIILNEMGRIYYLKMASMISLGIKGVLWGLLWMLGM